MKNIDEFPNQIIKLSKLLKEIGAKGGDGDGDVGFRFKTKTNEKSCENCGEKLNDNEEVIIDGKRLREMRDICRDEGRKKTLEEMDKLLDKLWVEDDNALCKDNHMTGWNDCINELTDFTEKEIKLLKEPKGDSQ